MLKKLKKRVAKGFTLVEITLSKSFYFGQEKRPPFKRPLDLPVNI
ncbi:hypothetical protein [Limosilactobacillus fermentum]|nr:hypothetical protein [Limosilactobacillus fermentum]